MSTLATHPVPDQLNSTYCFAGGSRYLHSTFFSRQFLHGFVSSHFAFSCLQFSQAYSIFCISDYCRHVQTGGYRVIPYVRRPLRFPLGTGILDLQRGKHLGRRPVAVGGLIVLLRRRRLLRGGRRRMIALRQTWGPVQRRRMRHRHAVVVAHVPARVLGMVLDRMRMTMRYGREAVDGVAGRARTTQLRERRLVHVALHDRVPRGVRGIGRVSWGGGELSWRVLDRRIELVVMVVMAVVVEGLVVSRRQRRLGRTRERGRRLVLGRRRWWMVRASRDGRVVWRSRLRERDALALYLIRP